MNQTRGIPQNIGGAPLRINITPDMLSYYIGLIQNQLIDKGDSSETKGAWTVQEDELLKDAVEKIGTCKWIEIAKLVPSRSPKQCRERWHNRLSPELKHVPFEPWEDQIIISKQKELGNKWSLIAQSLPGRSSGAVKNRWYASLKSPQNQFSLPSQISDNQLVQDQLDQV